MMTKIFRTAIVLSLCCQAAVAQMPVEPIATIYENYTPVKMRYWFDLDYASATELPYASGKTAININHLREGFHTIHFQVIDNHGATSGVRFSTFFIPEWSTETLYVDYTPVKMRYWFDLDYASATELPYVSGKTAININHLREGFHTIHFQVIDNHGATSGVRFSTFFIPEWSTETLYVDYTPVKMRYWFDLDYASATEVPYASGKTAININHLREGFHTIHYQVIDNHGATAGVRFATFFIPERSMDDIYDPYTIKMVRYWTDQDATTMRTVAYTSGVQTVDLDYLSEGVHTLYYQLVTRDGEVSPVRTTTIERCSLYDIYVSFPTEFNVNSVGSNPLFAQKPDLRLHYDLADAETCGHLTVALGTKLQIGKYVQASHWGSNDGNERFANAGEDYYHPTTLVNNGNMTAEDVVVEQSLYRDRWHFISLPFNVSMTDISAPASTYWVARTYDGAARAAGEMGSTWTTLRSGDKMNAGRGYILQLTNEGAEKSAKLTFKARDDQQKNAIFATTDVSIPLETYPSELPHNSSWNLVGNPYPSFYDVGYMNLQSPITVWNGSGYAAYSPLDDDFVLMPFEAFFVQKPDGVSSLTFSKDGRQHTADVGAGPATARQSAARQSSTATYRHVLNFTLATVAPDLQSSTMLDRSRVVINEQASMGYEQDKDAPKFMEDRPQKAQLMSLESGVQYAINERPMGDGLILFSVYAPEDGEYRFGIGDNSYGLSDDVLVYDTETGEVWSLADGDYVFSAREGMNDARLVVSLTGEATAITQLTANADGELKVVDNSLSFHFLQAKDIKVYSLDGRMLYGGTMANGSIKLHSGFYVVDINGETTKIMVK